jgi:multicomponent Na+:H+ antiporter subunit F
MNVGGGGAVEVVLTPVFMMLLTAIFLAFWRLVRGPSLPDRVVALDVIASLSLGMIVVYAISANQPVYVDAAIALALIAFLGTVAFAQYIERRARDG